MSTEVKRRRGTSSQCDAMTPAEAEVVIDLTNDRQRIGDGITPGGIHVPNERDLRRQNFVFGIAGGTGNSLTLTFAVPVFEYSQGLALEFQASSNNTGNVTINASGLGVRDIYKVSGNSVVELSGGEIITGGIYRITYDGIRFILHSVPEVNQSVAGMILLGTRSGVAHEYIGLDPSYNHKLVFTGISGAVNKYIRVNNLTSASYRCALDGFNTAGPSATTGIFLSLNTNNSCSGSLDLIGDRFYLNSFDPSPGAGYRLNNWDNFTSGSAVTSIRIVNGNNNTILTSGISSLYRYEQ